MGGSEPCGGRGARAFAHMSLSPRGSAGGRGIRATTRLCWLREGQIELRSAPANARFVRAVIDSGSRQAGEDFLVHGLDVGDFVQVQFFAFSNQIRAVKGHKEKIFDDKLCGLFGAGAVCPCDAAVASDELPCLRDLHGKLPGAFSLVSVRLPPAGAKTGTRAGVGGSLSGLKSHPLFGGMRGPGSRRVHPRLRRAPSRWLSQGGALTSNGVGFREPGYAGGQRRGGSSRVFCEDRGVSRACFGKLFTAWPQEEGRAALRFGAAVEAAGPRG